MSSSPIKKLKRNDKLIWVASNDGKYSVKNGYKTLIHLQRWVEVEVPLNLCWDFACLPKARFFLWLAFQNRIPTANRFRELGFEGPSRCSLCKQSSKDFDHLLYSVHILKPVEIGSNKG